MKIIYAITAINPYLPSLIIVSIFFRLIKRKEKNASINTVY